MGSLFTAKKINDPHAPAFHDPKSTPLPVDVYHIKDKLIILAPIAGVTIEEISVSITDDILTIKGKRQKPEEVDRGEYFSQECFWGEFSRSIVLPVQVNSNKVAAFYKKGTLRIEMPIIDEEQTRVIPVTMIDEDEA